MSVFLGFCDESGNYTSKRTTKWLKHNPFFVTSTVIIHSSDWKPLTSRIADLKAKYGIPEYQEVKYSHLFELYKAETNQKKDKLVNGMAYLANLRYDDLVAYVDEVLTSLSALPLNHCSLFCLVTNNREAMKWEDNTILKWHLQNTMQRFNMEVETIKSDESEYGILAIDTKGEAKDHLLRRTYDSLFQTGDFVTYDYLMDGLHIQVSHHSVGIQLADLVAGVTVGWLRDFPTTSEMFEKRIYPRLRKQPKIGRLLGYGLVMVPNRRSVQFHRYLTEKLDRCARRK